MIPVKFRDIIITQGGDGVMVSKMDGSLFVYTFEEWDRIKERILSITRQNERMRRFRRIFVGGAHECYCDKRGRILIPPTLRQDAELEKEIVLAGIHSYFEIWSRKNWNEEATHMKQGLKNDNVRSEVLRLLH